MSSWKASAGLMCAVVLFVPLILVIAPERQEPSTEPQNLAEVLAIAKELGWHVGTDRLDGQLCTRRIILSETPISTEEISLLAYGRDEDSSWRGRVAVYDERWRNTDTVSIYRDMLPWGNYIVYGDARMIEVLFRTVERKRAA